MAPDRNYIGGFYRVPYLFELLKFFVFVLVF